MKITRKSIKALGLDWSRIRVRVTPNPSRCQWYIDLRVPGGDGFDIIYVARSYDSTHEISKKLAGWIGEFSRGPKYGRAWPSTARKTKGTFRE